MMNIDTLLMCISSPQDSSVQEIDAYPKKEFFLDYNYHLDVQWTFLTFRPISLVSLHVDQQNQAEESTSSTNMSSRIDTHTLSCTTV